MSPVEPQNAPIYDTTLELPAKCSNTFIYGMVHVEEAAAYNEPGYYEKIVDLGVKFKTQPVIQLTEKQAMDPEGTVLDTGEHQIYYRWLDVDGVNFSKFAVVVHTFRANYAPVVSYLVAGRLGFFQRRAYCRSR